MYLDRYARKFIETMETRDTSTRETCWRGTAGRLLRNGGWDFAGWVDRPLNPESPTLLRVDEAMMLANEYATFLGASSFGTVNALYLFESMYFIPYLREKAPDKVDAFLKHMPWRLMCAVSMALDRKHPVLKADPHSLDGTVVIKYKPTSITMYHAITRDGNVQVSHQLNCAFMDEPQPRLINLLDIDPTQPIELQYEVREGEWSVFKTALI